MTGPMRQPADTAMDETGYAGGMWAEGSVSELITIRTIMGYDKGEKGRLQEH